jgi:protein SCO1/2
MGIELTKKDHDYYYGSYSSFHIHEEMLKDSVRTRAYQRAIEQNPDDFKGKVVVVFFGYTQCPDVCPTTLTEMQQVMTILGPQSDKVQVLFVTVDPQRDTAGILKQYVPAFDPRFLGLRPADDAALEKVAKDFKIYYKKVPGISPGSYTIDHTAGSYAFDPEGRLRLYIKHAQGPETLAHDLKELLK